MPRHHHFFNQSSIPFIPPPVTPSPLQLFQSMPLSPPFPPIMFLGHCSILSTFPRDSFHAPAHVSHCLSHSDTPHSLPHFPDACYHFPILVLPLSQFSSTCRSFHSYLIPHSCPLPTSTLPGPSPNPSRPSVTPSPVSQSASRPPLTPPPPTRYRSFLYAHNTAVTP